MKIKHWQGYGSVNAVKKGKPKVVRNTDIRYAGLGEELCELTVTVSGNHEWGIEHDDKYDIFNWLLKKFDKSVNDSRCIVKLGTNPYHGKVNGVDTEFCDYTILYRKAA